MTDRTLQRMIHVGCKQLGLDSDMRHDLQLVATGKASMSDMTDADLHKVVEALKNRGFKVTGGGRSKGCKPLAPRGDLRLIHVLWRKLGDAGALRDPGRDGLNRFIRARFGDAWSSVPADVDMLTRPAQINAVIRALKDWCGRERIDLNRRAKR